MSEEGDNWEDDWYTPESIAWKLYNETFSEAMSASVLGFGPVGDNDHVSYIFEMLLSVFFEMLFQMMVIDNAKFMEEKAERGEDVDDSDLEPDFEDFNFGLFMPIIETKFKRISYLVNVVDYERNGDEFDMEYVNNMMKERFCRVILRHNYEDTHYFDEIGSDSNYDFIPSEGFEKKNNLRDVFAVLKLNNKIYKIYFSRIDKIGSNIIVDNVNSYM